MFRTLQALLVGAAVATAAPLAGQSVQLAGARPPKFPAGQLTELATSESNPRQQYAVYVPSRYRSDRTWPLLVVMDPRGRAMIPLSRLREVSERLGYIAISSYNSRSDVTVDPNADVINTVLADAQRQFSIDIHRIYLVGQSGTARASWIFGYGLRGHVAGIIGIGASKPANFVLTPRPEGELPALVFFGAAGTTDYNYEEMSALDTALTRVNLPHHITWYDGPHAWAPQATLTAGVEFMELMAMRYGLKPADSAWIDSSYTARLASAAKMADSGDGYHAWLEYKAIASDFAGLKDVKEPAGRADRLEKRDDVRRTTRQIQESIRAQRAYNDRLGEFLASYRKGAPIPVATAADRVQLRALERRMAGTDSIDANAASRGIEQLWVYASFYEPMDYLDQNDPDRALGILDLAALMRPHDPEVCWQQARAFARLKRETQALSALECAARAPISPESIEQDPDLRTLAAAPIYRALVARLKARPASVETRYGQ